MLAWIRGNVGMKEGTQTIFLQGLAKLDFIEAQGIKIQK